ncbi:uncharacterized protein LOC143228003 [Tachypleus tridentatus]|uniref:uncharacterized protein LOC143228003 n=1 Tax=Tachypleus tridentatus TaxID=6853 RepID=UPI003FD26722
MPIRTFAFTTVLLISVTGAQNFHSNVSHVDKDVGSEMVTSRTRAYLSCESGEMVLNINFTKPFRGVIYINYNYSNPCNLYGHGGRYYELRIPLTACGTKQETPRAFINNVVVRFHRSLEVDEDEFKTVICRYPPPLASHPNDVITPRLAPIPPLSDVSTSKISEVELLLIVCGLFFLTLLLLGVGVSYYCLKKRNVKVVRRKRNVSSVPSSEITKLSSSGGGQVFGPIIIPRIFAVSSLGSETTKFSSGSSQIDSGGTIETFPSDYFTESPSYNNSDEDLESRGALSLEDAGCQLDNRCFVSSGGGERSIFPPDQECLQTLTFLSAECLRKFSNLPNSARRQLLTRSKKNDQKSETETLNEHLIKAGNLSKTNFCSNSECIFNPPVYVENPESNAVADPYWTHSEAFEPINRVCNPYWILSEEFEPINPSPKLSSPHAYLICGNGPDNNNRSHRKVETNPSATMYLQNLRRLHLSNVKNCPVSTTTTNVEETKSVERQHLRTENQVVEYTQNRSSQKTVTSNVQSQKEPRGAGKSSFNSKADEISSMECLKTYKTKATSRNSRAPSAVNFRQYSVGSDADEEEGASLSQGEVAGAFSIEEMVFRVLYPLSASVAKDLTIKDKQKWMIMISLDAVFRSLIHKATTIKDFTNVIQDKRYKNLYSPEKWEVIIRTLTTPNNRNNRRNRKDMKCSCYTKKDNNNSDSNRRSLSPLHDTENYVTDRCSSSVHCRSASRDFGGRQPMTGLDIYFKCTDKESLCSLDSSYTKRTVRSAAERSCFEYVTEVPTISSYRSLCERKQPAIEYFHSPEEWYNDNNDNHSRPLPTSGGKRRRFLYSCLNRPVLERSTSEITITTPILTTLDKASSVDLREKISTTEADIYD